MSGASVRAHDDVLGYLVKHAHATLETATDTALIPFALTARELGALRVVAGGEATSQQEVASVLGVDRSSMVALLDVLEARGVVTRRPSEADRRRNILELTDTGHELFKKAEAASLDAERSFTAALTASEADELRRLLRTVL